MQIVRITLLGLLLSTSTFARQWTDKRGRTVIAELVGIQDGQAILKKSDGKKITVTLSNLSAADQKFISANKASFASHDRTAKAGESKEFGFAKVTLKESSKAHPADHAQRTQELVIEFTEGPRLANEYTLRIAFASGSPDGNISPMAFRAAPDKAGFGNGHASYPLSKDQLEITELTIPIPRYNDLAFMGYQLELLDGETRIDNHYWEDTQLLETITNKLQVDKDFWHKGVFDN